ncbi:hypothetical protein HBE96_23170 [Clostridium sp. P21]|uniref:Uncharacterized protein n=1 Tax=Clostridium muellerianum TaxID=2716538 RepID=A0A7Y0EL44_9CLOT|nr:hypothetical protein [Clostridium muellerianum]NMM65483.1 hypothetical protein [Clostridium muellerianum]
MGDLKEIKELFKQGYKIMEVEKDIYAVPGKNGGVVTLKKENEEKKIQIKGKDIDIIFDKFMKE